MLLIVKKAMRLPIEIWATTQALTATDYSRHWLKLALFSLLLSGFFSLVIVFARTPGISGWITDPLFARKSLVLHVNFSLVVWFYSFLAVLAISLSRPVRSVPLTLAVKLAVVGVALMASSLFMPGADPVLANYIPVLDHPLFLTGLLLFGLGTVFIFVCCSSVKVEDRSPDRPAFYSDNAREAIRMAGYLIPLAIMTILASWIITPTGSEVNIFYERVMWGGGHILQFANVLGMITVWLILIRKLSGRELFSKRFNFVLLAVLVLPAAFSPLLLIHGTTSQFYYGGFTSLMRWFIFPVVSIYLAAGMWVVWRSKFEGFITGKLRNNVLYNGLLVSVLLTVTGFIIGAMIKSSNTLIPAHYHASLGGVTVAYMVMIFLLMNEYGYRFREGRIAGLVQWQPLLFGLGQLMFVIGFAYAGLHGMGRKLFGQDQAIHTLEAWIGLAAMSIGGLMAVTGGGLFIWIVINSFKRGRKNRENLENCQHIL